MEVINLLKKSIGLSFLDGKATVSLWAPFAKKVTLQNITQGKHLQLEAKDYGYWQTETNNLKTGDRYMFSLDDDNPLPDPASLSQPEGVHKPSEAIDIKDFNWTDNDWVNPDFGDYILYELHTGTFTEQGTFESIISKFEHLKSLGVNAIELMPVAQFPGERNWGYDGVYPFAVQQSYGGAKALQAFVDTCHSHGFAVVLDVVYNHVGPEGNYLGTFAPYFTDKYKTPWGSAVNYDDAYCDPVRLFVIENALMWLRDFHIDALRLDAVHAIKDYSPNHIIKEMNEAVSLLNQIMTSPKYLIAETDLNNSRFIRGRKEDGYGLRAQWCDEFHHSMRVAAGQERTGYYKDFNGVADLAKSMKHAYVHTGQYSPSRHQKFGTSTKGITADHFVVFDQNHDQVGNRMLGERISQLVSYEMQKLMAAVVLTAPFVPLLFMGEEWGASTPFTYFVDHSDPALVQAIAKGRKEEFSHFNQTGEPLPAHDRATFLKSKLNWEEITHTSHDALLKYYQRLIYLRKNLLPLKNYDRSATEVLCNEEKEVIILERANKEQVVLCVFNFSKQSHEITLQENLYPLNILLSSANEEWGGNKNEPYQTTLHKPFEIQPESVIILANVPA